MTLPEPAKERWQPLRAGLVDLFYYDVEEFHFHHGSLLLRGNNGTGKSKVLALTVPFLLDGELAAHRVEPDGDRNKRMEWNLLLGGKYPHPERLGYTWLEFGRRDADGATHFVTIGCGLKAASGRGVVRHWYFVTGQRIGVDLALLTPSRTALTRDRLREALGDRGMLYDRAVDYRRAVDEALFQLGSRYETLVSLLIQLRQPQLSKRPDEKHLSRALTEALPPLDENLIAQAAEAFRSLDDEREAITVLRETKRAADDFLGTYRRYARAATRRGAEVPRQAQSRFEQVGRDLGEAQRAHAEATEALETAITATDSAAAERHTLTARDRALRESPEARLAANLDQAADLARQLADLASSRHEGQREAQVAVGRLTERLARDTTALSAADATERGLRTEADRHAAGARIADLHRERIGTAHAAAGAAEIADWRQRSVAALGGFLDTADQAGREVHTARADVDRATAAVAAADSRVTDAERATADAGTSLVDATRAHLTAARELHLPVEDVVAALGLWVETLDGDNPAAVAAADAHHTAQAGHARRRSELEAESAAVGRERDQATAEIEQLTVGGHRPPPAPHTRDPQARDGRPGAPLWTVVDFASDVPEADRPGLEAALEAAGILDAWIEPDGTLVDATLLDGTMLDVLLRGGDTVPHNLSRVLVPTVDGGPVGAATVRRILDSIGLGPQDEAATWVSVDGRFTVGALTGRWAKPTAVHIGESARTAARRARIAELREFLAGTAARFATIGAALAELEERQQTLLGELRNLPRDIELRDRHAATRHEHAQRRMLSDSLAEARDELRRSAEAAAEAHERVAEFATDVGLPTDRPALTVVSRAVTDYRLTLAALWPAVSAAHTARQRAAETQAELTAAQERASIATAAAGEARRNADAARERHQVLSDTVGTKVAELQQQLADTAGALERVAALEAAGRDAADAAREARGRADGRRQTLTDDLADATRARDDAVEALRQFAGTGLIALACPDVETPDPDSPWAPTPAVQVARAIDRALADVDGGDRRWESLQQAVTAAFKLLSDGLSRHGNQAGMSVREGAMLVDVTFQSRTRTVPNLVAALDEEVEDRHRVLSAREREVLETHLVNEVAGTLQELVSAAERQVVDMNRELEDRPTSTGMRLRLVWRPARDAPSGLAELRGRLLRQTSDVWNDDDRRRIGAFLQEQITLERSRDDAGTWHEQLRRALDYRSWHEFVIQRYQDGQWRPATGPASGGERVLAASVPLFAAASSYYGSAGPHAPRIIALDEAFAGVDDDSRAKCLGLLAKFDLDVVMTSEREWGCYPQVPGLAIAQLARVDGVDAVLVTPWRWDGHGHRYRVTT